MSKGKKKAKRRKSVPFHDRNAIDDGGALAGRDLEICWLKDPIDAFFAHIQGSARVRLDDGEILPAELPGGQRPSLRGGRQVPDRAQHHLEDEMSMDRIREWMERNPDEGKELRRRNKSYVFFRETDLPGDEEPVGAQGISLTPGRSIAVDRNLHVYGTPFFISAMLPIETLQPTTPFRRLMIAQDTGGAIIGPARADIYFGAGDEAGSVSGRLRHPGRFVMLVPNGMSVAEPEEIPLPPKRPSGALLADQEKQPEAPANDEATSEAKPVAKSDTGKKHEPKVKVAKKTDKDDKKADKKPDKKAAEFDRHSVASTGSTADAKAADKQAGQEGRQEIREEVREEAARKEREKGRQETSAQAQGQAGIQVQVMSRRRLSDEERALWSGVTRSIAPLRRRPREDLPAEWRRRGLPKPVRERCRAVAGAGAPTAAAAARAARPPAQAARSRAAAAPSTAGSTCTA